MTPAEILAALRANNGYRGPSRTRVACYVAMVGECGWTMRRTLKAKPTDIPWDRLSDEGRIALERWLEHRAATQTPEDALLCQYAGFRPVHETTAQRALRTYLRPLGANPSVFALRWHAGAPRSESAVRRLADGSAVPRAV